MDWLIGIDMLGIEEASWLMFRLGNAEFYWEGSYKLGILLVLAYKFKLGSKLWLPSGSSKEGRL